MAIVGCWIEEGGVSDGYSLRRGEEIPDNTSTGLIVGDTNLSSCRQFQQVTAIRQRRYQHSRRRQDYAFELAESLFHPISRHHQPCGYRMDLPPIIYIMTLLASFMIRDLSGISRSPLVRRSPFMHHAASRRFRPGRQKHFVYNAFYLFPGYRLLVRFLSCQRSWVK